MNRTHGLASRAAFRSIALAALAALAPLAQAGYTTLSLPEVNFDLRTFTDGATYIPLFPSTPTWNGVPFQLSLEANGNNVFLAFGGSIDIPVGVFGVTQAYTLINSAVGVFGANNGSVEFFGSNGGYYKVDLIQGTNIRDHFDGLYNNVIDNLNAIEAFNVGPGRARLDEQIFDLPAAFGSETLNTIRFTGLPSVADSGNPFIAAATVRVADIDTVPEPTSVALLLAGLLGLGALSRRQDKAMA